VAGQPARLLCHVKFIIMPAPIATSLTAILAAVKTQLQTVTDLPVNLIRIVARGQTPRFQGDQDILLRPGDVSWDKGFDSGSGRVCAIIRRPLLVHIRTRFDVDMSDQDDSRLLDATYGHIPLEETVCNALLDFLPADDSSNLLTQEPMHPIDYPAEEKQEGQASAWIESRLAFQLTYQLPLNPQSE